MHTFTTRKARSGGALKVIGIGCAVIVVLGIGIAIFVAMNWRKWGANAASTVMVAVIDELTISDAQKTELKSQVDRLAQDFKDKKITIEQLVQIGEKLGTGPVPNLAMLMAIETENVTNVNLGDEEKADASLQFQRYSRGVVEGDISIGELELLVNPYLVSDGQGGQEIKSNMTDAEREELVEALKTRADEDEISDEPFEIDFAALFDEAIDEVVGTSGAGGDAPPLATVPERSDAPWALAAL